MPAINLPSINIGSDDFKSKEAMNNILDTLTKYRKELNFLLMNLDIDNMPSIGGIISDIEGNYSVLNQTVDGVIIQVGNTQGDLADLVITAQGIQSQVTTNKGDISTVTQTANGLSSTVSSLSSTVGTNSSNISQLSNEITAKVSTTDYTGNEIVSRLNLTSTTLTVDALKINLNGITRVNKELQLGSSGVELGTIRFHNNAMISATDLGVMVGLCLSASNVEIGSYTWFSGQVHFGEATSVTGLNIAFS